MLISLQVQNSQSSRINLVKAPKGGSHTLHKELHTNTIWTLNTGHKQYLQKIINLCMKDGKKNKSFNIISNTLRRLCYSERKAIFSQNKEPSPNCFLFSLRASNIKGNTCGLQRNPEVCLQSRTLPKVFLLEGPCRSTPFGLLLLINAIENVKPIIEVKKVRISGQLLAVPSIIPKNRQIYLAFRWILEAAILRRNAKKNLTLEQCFFAELIDASNNVGTVRKRRDDLHRMAESNRGFAHYRWWGR